MGLPQAGRGLPEAEGESGGAVKSGGLGAVLRDLPGPPVPENPTHTLGFEGLPDSLDRWGMSTVGSVLLTPDVLLLGHGMSHF